MRKALLFLPFTAILLAAGVLLGDLGPSLANTEIPSADVASATAAGATPADAAKDDWTETGKKVPIVKSNYQKPNEPYPPGSRRKKK